MATRSAGTLITTHNATYIPPTLMPGYQGHCPTQKFDYGETYGHSTKKYFQDYRSKTLYESKDPLNRGGNFPTYYTHNPDLVIGNRSRTRDRFLTAPRFRHFNVDHDRKRELSGFDKMAQQQREFYKDKSGYIKKVEHFQIPVRAEDQFKKHVPFAILSTRHSDLIHLPGLNNISSRRPMVTDFAPVSMVKDRSVHLRDRAIRDIYFESRGQVPVR